MLKELVRLTIDEVEKVAAQVERDIYNGEAVDPLIYHLYWMRNYVWKTYGRLDVNGFNRMANLSESDWRVIFNPR